MPWMSGGGTSSGGGSTSAGGVMVSSGDGGMSRALTDGISQLASLIPSPLPTATTSTAAAAAAATAASAAVTQIVSVIAAAAALLFCEKGSFQPELQIFTRGCTNAFKRCAVMLLEDAWVVAAQPSDTERRVLAMLALALATQRMPDYEPPVRPIVATLRLLAQATVSRCVIAWRAEDSQRSSESMAVCDQAVRALRASANRSKKLVSSQFHQ